MWYWNTNNDLVDTGLSGHRCLGSAPIKQIQIFYNFCWCMTWPGRDITWRGWTFDQKSISQHMDCFHPSTCSGADVEQHHEFENIFQILVDEELRLVFRSVLDFVLTLRSSTTRLRSNSTWHVRADSSEGWERFYTFIWTWMFALCTWYVRLFLGYHDDLHGIKRLALKAPFGHMHTSSFFHLHITNMLARKVWWMSRN